MFKMISAMAALVFSMTANAATLSEVVYSQQQQAITNSVVAQGIDWKVGDNANYSVDMGFLKGTMVMAVKSIGADGIWITQDMDLGFAGKQKAEILIDQNTGATKKFIVNGQEQQIPENKMEVISVTEDKITVPAGTFDCIHAVLKDTEKNEEMNMWVNPQVIPISGMLKQVAPSQFGNVTVLLKSFKKN